MGSPRMGDARTFCRICEPSCGLIAQVVDGRLVKLTPDRDHPVTKGFACHKGLAAVDVHHDPDRLDHPMLRATDDAWHTVGWDEAMADTARRLRAVTDAHGAGAVTAYVGNPTAFNALGSLHTGTLLRALGVRRTFSSGTQDCANKFVASAPPTRCRCTPPTLLPRVSPTGRPSRLAATTGRSTRWSSSTLI